MSDPSSKVRLDPVERAIADIAAGKAVVVVDDEDRENEGDIIFAAAKATPELMAWTIRHSSGVICVPMPGAMLDRLEIPLMTPHNKDKMRTAYTISVDARDGVSTGISAADRAHTARVLADSATEPWEITRPGHVFPLRYRDGGVLVRRGHTEAAVDLAKLAGLTPAGVLVEVVNDDGTMKRAPELRAFADEHDLAMISIEELVKYRRRTELHVIRDAETRLPTSHGDFTGYGYTITVDGSEHVALVYGDPTALTDGEPVLTRVHSECLTGDVFGSSRCDCGPQLNEAMDRIVEEGRGVVVYLRGHEGRGIGLVAKLQAYQLQDGGRDTVDANLDLGLPADARHYGAATQILRDLGISQVRLLTNNPDKVSNLEDYGIKVTERVPLTPHPNDHNLAYLLTKRDRMGHHLPDLDSRSELMAGHGAPAAQPIDCHDLRVAVVAASWHTQVMDGLIAGAQRAFRDHRLEAPVVVRVPGTFELPVVAAALASQQYDAVVALGVVIRGGTPHFDYVCTAATDGLTRVALDHQVAIGFGVLTCDTEEQALDRAGLEGSQEDKGYEATSAALLTAQTLRKVKRHTP